MAAVLTKSAAAAITTASSAASADAQTLETEARKQRRLAKYAGGSERRLPPVTDASAVSSIAVLIADYNRMWDALTLVKADAAYATLDTATKAAVATDCGF